MHDIIHKLLFSLFEKYDFDLEALKNWMESGISESKFHNILHSLNEKTTEQKANGIYNTPNDVVDFVIENSKPQGDKFLTSTVLDPTVGSGEFLVRTFQAKINICEELADDKCLNILATLYGNDIDPLAIEICKVRLFFEIQKHISHKNYKKAAEILNQNLTTFDFINVDDANAFGQKFDLILGNPPYVEDRKSKITPNIRYGNVFANILHNSMDMLTSNGKMGFIIPISYISTQRMGKIRKYVEQNANWQKVLSFADRPSCLFTGVHQKLNILIAEKGEKQHKIFTSGYNFWYKSERDSLFNKITTIENPYVNQNFYPKLGDAMDLGIYSKIHSSNNDGFISLQNSGVANVFINMRACFWIKAFSFPFESKEYKGFCFEESKKWHILALLNSSLFWWYWTAVSDCWHITNKELSGFAIPPQIFEYPELAKLAQRLETELERTKATINTKQTNFEYKHRLCRNVIDQIDDIAGKFYGLTDVEISHIKKFQKIYRDSLGVNT